MFVYVFLIIILIMVLYPLVYVISASISDPKLVHSGEMWLWPMGFNVEGYKLILEYEQIWVGYRNTILYTILGVSINLFVTLPAAFALAQNKLVGRNLFMMMLVFTMFFSGGLIPTYLLVKNLGLINTVWAMVLPNAAAVWNIILCTTFFRVTIPKELTEAAVIDGCSTTKMFLRIVLPLSMPIIAVMSLFYGVGHWNEYFSALIYLSDESKYTLQLVLRQILVLQELGNDNVQSTITSTTAEAMQHRQTLAEIMKYSVIIVSTLPMIIAYPFLQRFFVKGVMIGSLKG
ncbi:carbohydrate ABC transporter permease [Aureibacillus halotolerans]|nr:carbohydrate ABC transporter permease [Aureibacillus halotolerans]